jgi:hypothetical protein
MTRPGPAVMVLAQALTAAWGAGQAAAAEDEPLEQTEAERLDTVEQRLGQLEQVQAQLRPRLAFAGFIDVGAFVAQGDGTGFVQDVGPPGARAFPGCARAFPGYVDRYAWVFLGDLLSTAVNSRGEPADLGNPPGLTRADSIASRGAPSFIANEVNLRLRATVADSAVAVASVSFVPRSGRDFSAGDGFEVELAHLEWMIGAARRTSLFFGKIDPVMGIEYRERKADHRFGITPSLIARYTSGTPVGLKLRSKLASERLVFAAAVTNGSSGIEGFHFHDEIDSNAGKTGSARLAVVPPLPFALELGVSAEYGSQDRALDSEDALWFVGLDLQAQLGPVTLKAEWLRGEGTGERAQVYTEPHRPWGLTLRSGGYAELDVRLPGQLGALVRVEHRDADVRLGNPAAAGGAERLYITRGWRLTVGARWAVSHRVVVKGEFLKNGEYGGVPGIRNDVVTSSLVLSY